MDEKSVNGGKLFTFGSADAGRVKKTGVTARKLTPIHAIPRWDVAGNDDVVVVLTDEGEMKCPVGGWIVCDAAASQVWPISGEYMEEHYEIVRIG